MKFKNLTYSLISSLFAFLCVSNSSAQDVIQLNQNLDEYVIDNNYWRVFKDSKNNIKSTELITIDFDLSEIDYAANPDWNEVSFWFKTKVFNKSGEDEWVFEVPDPNIDQVDLFIQKQKGEINQMTTRSKRLSHKNCSYQFRLKQDESAIIYVRLKSKKSFGTVFKIRSLDRFIGYSLAEYILLGIYYGVLILIITTNLFIYFNLKQKVYLYYIGYVFLLGLRSLTDDGIGTYFLWNSYPDLNSVLGDCVPLILLIAFLLYSHSFLETKKWSPANYYLLNYIVGAYVIFNGMELIFGKVQFSNLIYTIPFIAIYINSIQIWRKGFRPARYFTIAYSVLVLSFVISFFKSVGAFNEDSSLFILLVYSVNIGFLMEVIILSHAMSDKFKTLESEKNRALNQVVEELRKNDELTQKVNRELEAKVKERTKELEESNQLLTETTQKMVEQSELVNQMNLKLDLANRKLEKESIKVIQDRIHLKGIGFEEFERIYPNDMTCYKFLRDLKWSNGYKCPKCGNEKYSNGNGPYARKCSKCTYNESVKVNTIFQGLRFETVKAFYMVFLIIDTRGEISSYELADRLSLRQKTCWSFKKKLLDHIKKHKISYDQCKSKGWTDLVAI